VIAELAIAASALASSATYFAQDVPLQAPAIRVAGSSVVATQSTLEEGRTRPAKIPGLRPWRCAPTTYGGLACITGGPGPERAWRATISYRIIKHRARVVVNVGPW
jgi:hypothetical protein